MGVYGVGTDLVEIARIARAIARHGETFAARILSRTELDDYRNRQNQAAFLAKRFAAKEAIAKALGTGIGAELGLCDLTIGHTPSGRPRAEFSAKGRDTCRRLGVARVHLSLSDERRYANAFAVAEGSNDS